MLKGIQNGAQLYVVDPRRTTSAQWADVWLGLNVGTDIALANAMAREIIHAGLQDDTFIQRGTSNYAAYRASVESYTLEYAQRETGIPAAVIRDAAHAYAKADRAMVCWTLGITEHHNAVDNVLALINLSLLTGHVGRYGCGCNPLRGQNNVQGGGDMGALPNKLPGFQDVQKPEHRTKFEQAWGRDIIPKDGWHLTEMIHAMETKELNALYVIGENPAQSDADATHVTHILEHLEHLVVQEIFLTKTAQLAHVVLPATATWAEGEGTVTNSERRVQRVRKAVEPPDGARDEIWIMSELAKRLGYDWGHPTAEDAWNELRRILRQRQHSFLALASDGDIGVELTERRFRGNRAVRTYNNPSTAARAEKVEEFARHRKLGRRAAPEEIRRRRRNHRHLRSETRYFRGGLYIAQRQQLRVDQHSFVTGALQQRPAVAKLKR